LKRIFRNFLAILVLACVAGLCPVFDHAPAQETGDSSLRRNLMREKDRAEEGKRDILRLTRKERELYSDLAEIEREIESLQSELRDKEQRLLNLENDISRAENRIQELTLERERTARELNKLLQVLWKLHQKSVSGGGAAARSRLEADLEFTWTAAVYHQAERSLSALARQQREQAETASTRKGLMRQASAAIEEIRNTRDRLLDKKLSFVSSIRKTRAERLSKEEALEAILAAIEELGQRLQSGRGGDFDRNKGDLPLPAQGKIISSFGSGGGPASRGLHLELEEKQEIKSVYWGKVVHDDLIRGFGRVVIVNHGKDYYSLYAYLSESRVTVGREVEKGEILGLAGYNPSAEGPGLYFELRFKQKAINPMHWLAGR
jgi:septal ring factor EnvC (AmiA/AmiB activator)